MICFYGKVQCKKFFQSELLFLDWYNCDWYNESEDFKFIVKLMLLFSRKTFVLSVGGFTNLSHKFLVQVSSEKSLII